MWLIPIIGNGSNIPLYLSITQVFKNIYHRQVFKRLSIIVYYARPRTLISYDPYTNLINMRYDPYTNPLLLWHI